MIHPIFREVPDPYTAEALSDIYGQPGEYKTISNAVSQVSNPNTTSFPPVRAYINVVTAALVDQSGVVRRPALVLGNPGGADPRQMIDAYKRTLDIGQIVAAPVNENPEVYGLTPSSDERFTPLAQWAIDRAIAEDKKLLAAHIIATSIEENQVLDALVVPKVVVDELPLLVRTGVEPIFTQPGSDGFRATLPEELSEIILNMMHGSKEAEILAMGAAASILPSPDIFERVIAASQGRL